MKTTRIALAQILCIDGDRPGNLARIEQAIQQAKDQQADLVCFPEMALYGWVNPDAHQRAQPIPGADVEALAKLAARYQIYLSIGLAEKDGDDLYDAAVLLDDQGRLLLKHRKCNVLTHLMSPPYSAGDDVAVIPTALGKIGILICADTFQRELVDRMKRLEPDLLLVPYGWAAPPDDWPQHGESLRNTIAGAARIVDCPVVGTNLVGSISQGPWQGMTYGGQSYAVAPDGQLLGKGCDRNPQVLTIEITR